LTAEFTVTDKLFNVNCQTQPGEISQWHHQTNPAFSTNMLGHTVVD